MNIFSAHGLTKSFNDVPLFEDIAFGMSVGERVGIIGSNGAGKTTLLQIIAGAEVPDAGTVAFNKGMRFEYLSQNPTFPKPITVLEAVMQARTTPFTLLKRHAELCALLHDRTDDALSSELHDTSIALEMNGGWTLESDAKTILQKLGVARFDDNVQQLSGGLRKRVAMANVLMSDADLLILDEPTNHLDANSVQWLQDRLQHSPRALLLITHDRYFLDAVTTRIVELERRKLWSYNGDYEFYVERKQELVANETATAEHLKNRLRREVEWLKRGARAQRKKQKSRVDWVENLQERQKMLRENVELKNIKIEVGSKFTGSQLVDAVNISKRIGERFLFQHFTYKALPGERIGIIGANGSGKSTLLNILAGEMPPDSGTVKIGSSAKIGYFRQESTDIAPTQSVIGAVREIAEYIDTGVGRDRYLSAKDFLERFNFHPRQFNALVGNLSGGERRRLGLLRVLMSDPNVLLLDEPTNDFDIPTLGALEEYLQHFLGCLIVVSHDRAFLDRTVEYIYAFEENERGETIIKQYPGNYSAYLETVERKSQEQAEQAKLQERREQQMRAAAQEQPKTNAYQRKRELDRLERVIAGLEKEKSEIEAALSAGHQMDYKMLTERSKRLLVLQHDLDAAVEQWVELSEHLSSNSN
jgi:ATP-binding cassette subfamily F protein uup